ncbi:MAG TPA: hypothetical protein VNO30_29910 [Kofleriaceae bacterium]|nr:hypothetical protein [Kofleriaceae bacterium]
MLINSGHPPAANPNQLAQLRSGELDNITHEITHHGIFLTSEQLEDLSELTILTLTRLGLNAKVTDTGTEFRVPPDREGEQ